MRLNIRLPALCSRSQPHRLLRRRPDHRPWQRPHVSRLPDHVHQSGRAFTARHRQLLYPHIMGCRRRSGRTHRWSLQRILGLPQRLLDSMDRQRIRSRILLPPDPPPLRVPQTPLITLVPPKCNVCVKPNDQRKLAYSGVASKGRNRRSVDCNVFATLFSWPMPDEPIILSAERTKNLRI